MNILSFIEPINISFRKSAGSHTMTFEAGRDYLFADAQFNHIMRDPNVHSRTYKVSKCDMRLETFNIKSETKRKRILVFNGSGGYGDQILVWPVCKILSEKHDVHVLVDPGNNVCFWNLDFIKSVSTIPILWEQVKLYDYVIVFEAVANMDEHNDQLHPVDIMLKHIGYDPESISPEQKCVRPKFTPGELGSLNQFTRMDKKIGIYQMSATNQVRCLPPGDSAFMAVKLSEAYPDTHWLCLYDEFVPPEYKSQLEAAITDRKITNMQPFCAPNLRELWALTEYVSCVVSPDSMMVHVAGVFGTPCVGLWGPMDPRNRVGYYKNHKALRHTEFCPHAPCFAYTNTFPKWCPPRPGARTSCDVLAGISPQEVIDAVKLMRR